MEISYLDKNVEALVPDKARTRIWEMTRKITNDELMKDGAPGSACLLLDAYTLDYIRKLPPDEDAARQSMIELRSNLAAIAAVCVSLATKMMTAYAPSLRIVQNYLRSRGNNTSLFELIQLEVDVYQRNGLGMPIYTNVQQAQLLAQNFDCGERVVRMSGLVMDVTELFLSLIKTNVNKRRFLLTIRCNSHDPIAPIKWRHIIGAVVVTSWAVLNRHQEGIPQCEILNRASQWAEIDPLYMKLIAETILTMVKAGIAHSKASKTRREQDANDEPQNKKPRLAN